MIGLEHFFEARAELNLQSGYVLKGQPPDPKFEAAYLAVRQKENRLQTDELVRQLPKVHPSHPHYKEWGMRTKSTERFMAALQPAPEKTILDIGCGNGWFTHQIAQKAMATTIGLDVNASELEQAARLFQLPGLHFVLANLFDEDWKKSVFDTIVINSAIQYFSDLNVLMFQLGSLLKEGGQIHVLDSPFYPSAEVEAAKERTKEYYSNLGFPEMAEHYFHHTMEAIKIFKPEFLYQQKSKGWWPFREKDSPFPWLVIRKENL